MKPILTIIILLIYSNCFAQFRGTKWGMSRNEVIKIETAKVTNNSLRDGELTYSIELDDINCNLSYIFTNNKLTEIIYEFKPLVNDREYSRNILPKSKLYKKTIENIRKKYGKETKIIDDLSMLWKTTEYSIRVSNFSDKIFENVKVSYSPPTSAMDEIL